MKIPEPDSSKTAQYEAEVRRHLPRNYWANIFEGGIYMAGTALTSAETVLPALAQQLGASPSLIALMPVLIMLGFTIPPLINAQFVERLERVKPFVTILGFFQRLPYLIAGLVLFFFGDSNPGLALPFVMLAPFVSGLAGGIGVTAWFELVCRVIPAKNLSESWSFRLLIQGIGGLAAGGIITWTLREWPGVRGFGVLMLLTFVVLMVSYAVFLTIHEVVPPRRHIVAADETWLQGWLRRLQMVRADRVLQRFLSARSLAFAYLLPAPFMGIHAIATTGRGEQFLGLLVMAQMAGSIVANAIITPLGGRIAAKDIVLASRVTIVLTCVLLLVAKDATLFLTIFFLFGASFASQQVGFSTMFAQICPSGMRPSYLAIQSVFMLPVVLVVAWLSGWMMISFGVIAPIAIVTLVLELISLQQACLLPRRGRI